MKKYAVLFMLIFSLLSSGVFTGCGAGSQGTGKTAADNTVQGTDNVGGSKDAGNFDAQSPAIPETTESAVSDWGVAKAEGNANDSTNNKSGASAAGDPAGGTSEAGDASEIGGSAGGTSDAGGASFSQVIVDRDDLFFAIKDVKKDSVLGYTWKAYVENRTDKNLMFTFEKVAVNGVMCDPFWAEVITAGKKGNCEIIWMADALAEREITEVSRVDFTLNVYNDDDYMEAPLMHDPFTVYPLGDNNSGALVPRKPQEGDQILIDNDDCQIVVTGYDPENVWGYAVHLYLRNKTGEDLIFSAENTSVNGIMCDPFWAEIVTAGNAAISTILWDKTALNENDIGEVKEISLPVRVYSDKDIANPYVEETFELKP